MLAYSDLFDVKYMTGFGKIFPEGVFTGSVCLRYIYLESRDISLAMKKTLLTIRMIMT